MNFISNTNKIVVENTALKDRLITVSISEKTVAFSYTGDVEFFNDTDDLFGNVVGYNHTLNINIVYELSDPNLVLLNYKDDDIIEHIVQAIHDDI